MAEELGEQNDARGASVALAGLTHPACLLAMLVLGLNDRYLKQCMPGWFTGKLSDFAGVFFFPFVVGAIVGLVLPRIRDRRLRDGAIALTGLWFALAKCTEFGWAGTVAFAQSVVGSRSSIVQDPTDALALLMLVPAWWLWSELAKPPRPRRLALAGAPALVCAVLLSLATTVPPPRGVFQLRVEEDRLYALGLDEIYESADGLEWAPAQELPFEPSDSAMRHPSRTQTHELDWQGMHFFLNGDGRVYADAGAIEWETPPDREHFVRELARDSFLEYGFSLGPWDMVVFDDALIVALGTEGVARRETDGTWTRAAVGPAKPTPLVATSFNEVFIGATPLYAIALATFGMTPLALIVLVLAGGDARARRFALGGALILAASLIAVLMLDSLAQLLAWFGLLSGFTVAVWSWSALPTDTRKALAPKFNVTVSMFVPFYLALEAAYSLGWVSRWYFAPLAASVVALFWLVLAAWDSGEDLEAHEQACATLAKK